jgi:hypothetical protein
MMYGALPAKSKEFQANIPQSDPQISLPRRAGGSL